MNLLAVSLTVKETRQKEKEPPAPWLRGAVGASKTLQSKAAYDFVASQTKMPTHQSWYVDLFTVSA